MSNTIYTRGFLSQEIEEYRERFRNQYAAAFFVCEGRADKASARLFSANLDKLAADDQQHTLLAVAFWCRCVRACQGALLMLERGMVPEGQILIRSAYEFLFIGAALLKDASVVDRLIATDLHERKKQAQSMLDHCPWLGVEGETALRAILVRGSGTNAKTISAFDAAKIAGYLELYATVYRGMSLVASHGTATGTNSVFEDAGEDNFTMVYGPSDENLEFSVGLVQKCLEEGAERFHPHLPPREGTETDQAA